jgi:hypothetical protein
MLTFRIGFVFKVVTIVVHLEALIHVRLSLYHRFVSSLVRDAIEDIFTSRDIGSDHTLFISLTDSLRSLFPVSSRACSHLHSRTNLIQRTAATKSPAVPIFQEQPI